MNWRREAALAAVLAGVVLLGAGGTLAGAYWCNDAETQNLPQRAWFATGLRAGELRWWCSEAGAGYPLAAEGQTGCLYPGNLLFVPFEPTVAYSLTVLLHLWWAGLGVAAVLRQRHVGRLPALAAATAYAFCGPLWFRAIHLNFLQGLAWLPWWLWGLERGRTGRRGGWTAAGLALAAAVLAGHVHPPLFALLVGPLYLLGRGLEQHGVRATLGVAGWLIGSALLLLVALRVPLGWTVALPGLLAAATTLPRLLADPARRAAGRDWAGLAAALALAGLLAAGQVLPLLELVPQTVRAEGLSVERALDISLTPGQLLGLLVPRQHGTPFDRDLDFRVRWDTVLHWEWAGHVGLLTLLLAWGAPCCGRRRERWFWWALALLALGLAAGRDLPLYRGLLHLPGWHSLRGPARFLALHALAAAVLLGLVLHDLRGGLPARRQRLTRLGLLAATALLLSCAVALPRAAAGVLDPQHLRWLQLAWLRAALLAALATALLWRAGHGRRWLLAAAALAVVDVLSGSVGYQRLTDRAHYAPVAVPTPGERFWQPVYQPHPLQANQHLLSPGAANLGLYTPLALRRYQQVVERIQQVDDLAARRWLALLRVTSRQRGLWDSALPDPAALLPTGLRPFPPAWLTPRWERCQSPAAAFALSCDPAWRPEAYSLLESAATAPPRRGELGEVLWSEVGRHRVTVRATGDSPRVLVLSQVWYPGWRVHRTGVWQAAEPVDYLLTGTLLPPGPARVDFVFQPLSLRLGLFGSLSGLSLLSGLLAAGRPRPRPVLPRPPGPTVAVNRARQAVRRRRLLARASRRRR
ncbi:MAG: YfhO family protein [Fimbriimonadaceae bacterium]|nr:YfhO family protein [Fimbriimonadaceae bacterium]